MMLRCPHCGLDVHRQEAKPHIPLSELMDIVSDVTGVSKDYIVVSDKKMTKPLYDARHIYCYLAYFYTNEVIRTTASSINTSEAAVDRALRKIDVLIRIDFDVRINIREILKEMDKRGYNTIKKPFRRAAA
jgi:hypothetical protein